MTLIFGVRRSHTLGEIHRIDFDWFQNLTTQLYNTNDKNFYPLVLMSCGANLPIKILWGKIRFFPMLLAIGGKI